VVEVRVATIGLDPISYSTDMALEAIQIGDRLC